MKGLTPFLWFEKDAEQAAAFYVSTFDDAEVSNTVRYQENWPGPVVSFRSSYEFAGQGFCGLYPQRFQLLSLADEISRT